MAPVAGCPAQEVRHMSDRTVPLEAIDDDFVRVMMEELSWRSPTPAPAPPHGHVATKPEPHPGQPVPDAGSDTADAASVFATAQWRIRVTEEDGPDHVLLLSETPITIGRSRSNTVVVQCPRVSRRHLQIWVDEGWPRIVDLSGRLHMKVNGVRVSGSTLQNQDVVEIGSVSIFVEQVPGETTAPS